MNQQKQPSKSQGENESLLAILLLVLCAMLIALAIGTLVNNCNGDDSTPEQTTITTPAPNPDGEGDPPIDPSLLVPVFSGGVLPTVLPLENAETAALSGELNSASGVIVNATTNTVLAGKNADTPISPASMTKVMTLIVACEKLTKYDLTQKLTLTEYYNSYDYNGLDVGLLGDNYIGDSFLIEDLLYGIGVSSSADCVLMIAEKTYGSLGAFVEKMNQKAVSLGLVQTHFVDAAGDDLAGNTTTAKEMAVIMAYAMQNPLISKILSTSVHTFYGYYLKDGVEASYRRYFNSHLFESDATSSRMLRYKKEYGVSFSLKTTVGLLGKTGYLDNPDRSYLVCAATGSTTGNKYVVVVGENPGFAKTMSDIKYLFDTYAK